MTIQVTKRDGVKAPLDIEKIHKVVCYACNGINGVSASEVELKSQLSFYSGMKTETIQETLIKAASELISEESPNYQYVAGRLINFQLRKQVFGNYYPTALYKHVVDTINLGFYEPKLLEWYTKEEFDKMDSFMDHCRDESLTYGAMEQFRGKYLVKNRVNGTIFETPQIAYVLIAATLFHNYPKATRMKWVREFYDSVSQHYISLPTPIMAKVRTPQKQFSSCVLINTDDSLDSMASSWAAILKYVSQSAGIGVNVGRIRAKGSPVRNGDTQHTGIIPFIKTFQSVIKSCSQGGIRGGAGTLYYPIWHLEVEDLLVLKNNKGTDENRVRHLDYTVQLNKLFYERLVKNEDITLFCPNDVPEMYEAFFNNQEKFKMLYETAERNTKIRKKKVKAIDLFSNIMQERKDTGRLYIMNVDHCNTHGSFVEAVDPIYMSNLCCEITLPNKPMGQDDSTIALCTLAAINWGKIDSPEDFQKPCELAVRALDALLSYQDYPREEAKRHTNKYRPLGVGITNLAYWMAKNGLDYNGNQITYDTVDEFAEAWSYYLIKASADLQKEQAEYGVDHNGPQDKGPFTKYTEGILPIDTYKKEVDAITPFKKRMDWDGLRKELKSTGIRNATLMALMPCESSSQLLNSTNGIEPPRGYISHKVSKEGTLKQVIPGYSRLKNKYQLLWDIKSPDGYLKICAILQKYIDQSISVNTSYNPKHYKDGKVPMSELIRDLVNHYKNGGKCLYYCNTHDGAGEEDTTKDENTCADGVCKL